MLNDVKVKLKVTLVFIPVKNKCHITRHCLELWEGQEILDGLRRLSKAGDSLRMFACQFQIKAACELATEFNDFDDDTMDMWAEQYDRYHDDGEPTPEARRAELMAYLYGMDESDAEKLVMRSWCIPVAMPMQELEKVLGQVK